MTFGQDIGCPNHDTNFWTPCRLRFHFDSETSLISDLVIILEGGEFVKGFSTECGGINQGGNPRVPEAPRDVR